MFGISIFGKDAEIFGICIFTDGKLGRLKTGGVMFGKKFGKLGKGGKGGKLIGGKLGKLIGGKLGTIAASAPKFKGGNLRAAESQEPSS